jgi:hypothetical protein
MPASVPHGGGRELVYLFCRVATHVIAQGGVPRLETHVRARSPRRVGALDGLGTCPNASWVPVAATSAPFNFAIPSRQLATIALRWSRSERRFSTDQDAHGATTLAITADSTLDPRTSAAISTAQSWQVGPTQPDPVTQVPHVLLARCRFSRLPGRCRYESRKSAST